MARHAPAEPSASSLPVFDRIVCGIDASAAGLEAVRQVMRLRSPEGTLRLVTAVHLAKAAQAGFEASRAAEQLEREAQEALERALAEAGPVDSRLLQGDPVRSLLAEIERERATLVAVGSHERRRAAGVLLGSVATTLLHEAPCSVLLARAPLEPEWFPRGIVVGVDGSPEAAAAVTVARELAGRFGTELICMTMTGGKPVEVVALQSSPGELLVDPGRPVPALVDASAEVDLVVVGSRGLHGLSALGSVSERVAHNARCSVLVVRREPA